MFYYKNRFRFNDDEYHLVSMEQMAKFAERDNFEQETIYFSIMGAVRLDKIENGNFYFSFIDN